MPKFEVPSLASGVVLVIIIIIIIIQYAYKNQNFKV